MSPPSRPVASRELLRKLIVTLAIVCCGTALGRYGFFVSKLGVMLNFPYQIDYGEGIVWQQMRAIRDGHGYSPIDGFPAIVFHYPPLYHFITATVAGISGWDELYTGRLVSYIATLISGAALGGLFVLNAPRDSDRHVTAIVALATSLLAFTTLPVEFWSVLMRVDMVSLAFSMTGLCCGLLAVTRPRWIYAAALLFVAAIYTKQTAVAAPTAVFGTMLILRPRTALTGLATSLAVGLLALGWLSWQTDGRFLPHIVLYNINRFDPSSLSLLPLNFVVQFGLLLCAVTGIFAMISRLAGYRNLTWRRRIERLRDEPSEARLVITLGYFAILTPMLLMVAKSGATVNYLLEWDFALPLFAGMAFLSIVAPAIRSVQAPRAWLAGLMLLFLAFQLALQPLPGTWSRSILEQTEKSAAPLAMLVRAAPGPVLSDDMVAVLRGGKPVQWEPAIFAELASGGVWNEEPLLLALREHRFAFIATSEPLNSDLSRRRYSAGIAAAITENYPVEIACGAYRVHFPSGPLPDYARDIGR